jgi:8-oxo-dGTP pyrophosphatase MutT (NUDIX family)
MVRRPGRPPGSYDREVAPSRDRLLAELESHPPDPDGYTARDRFLSFVRDTADPFTRANVGHVTASTIITRAAGDAVLLRYHRKLGQWLQPGGHVEPEDDSVFEAAAREAREETGIEDFVAPSGSRILDVDVHDIPSWRGEPPHIHYDVRYLLIAPEGTAGSERHRTRWFPLDEILRDADPSLCRALGKARRWLGDAARAVPGRAFNS